MPKLPRISGRRLSGALQKAGFRLVRTQGDHAFLHNAATGRSATVPLTRDPLPTGTLASAIRQAGVSVDCLRDLLG